MESFQTARRQQQLSASQPGLTSDEKFPFPALNIKTSYINHHTEEWSKEGMLRVATTLENSNSTVFPLSVLCLIPWPGRAGGEAPQL